MTLGVDLTTVFSVCEPLLSAMLKSGHIAA